VFRNTNIRITYKCRNTIPNRIKPPRDHTPPHNQWGLYQLTCNMCNLLYVGQTSRSLSIRYKEHIRYTGSNNPQSAYALHILQNRHEYGPMDNTMTVLKHINNHSLLLNNTISKPSTTIENSFPSRAQAIQTPCSKRS